MKTFYQLALESVMAEKMWLAPVDDFPDVLFLIADAYEEAGDTIGERLRWIAENGYVPLPESSITRGPLWSAFRTTLVPGAHHYLPQQIIDVLANEPGATVFTHPPRDVLFTTFKQAYLALAKHVPFGPT